MGIAQVSYNITNIDISPMHQVFYESKKVAEELNIEVTGSETHRVNSSKSDAFCSKFLFNISR